MKNLVNYICVSLMVLCVFTGIALCFFTPGTDKFGNGTHLWKYWTDMEYVEKHF